MKNHSTIQYYEIISLGDLADEPNGDQKSSNPEESVDGKVSRRDKSGDPWGLQNLNSSHPVFYIHKAKPHVMSEDDPVYGDDPHSVENEQVLILCRSRHIDDLSKIVIEGKRFKNFNGKAFCFSHPRNYRAKNPQSCEKHKIGKSRIIGPVEDRLGFFRVIENSAKENTLWRPCFVHIEFV